MTPLLIIATLTAALAGPQDDYNAGISAARAGDPATAETHLHAALDGGAHHPAVYMALGNALYRQGELGAATAAWRRAALLAPRDGDISANLDRAQNEAEDRLEPPAHSPAAFFWHAWMSTWESALAAGLLLAGAVLALIARTLLRTTQPAVAPWGWESVILGCVGLVLSLSTIVTARMPEGAVVVAPEITARSTPGSDGVDLFVLHSGAEVLLLESHGDHALVGLSDARKAWLPRAALISSRPGAPFPR